MSCDLQSLRLSFSRKSPGLIVHVDERERMVGLKGLETCPVSFNETPVPESNVINSIGKGSEILMKVLEEQVKLIYKIRVSNILDMNEHLNDSSFCSLNVEIADRKLIFIGKLSFYQFLHNEAKLHR